MKALFFDNGENYSTEEFRGVFFNRRNCNKIISRF